MAAQYVCPYCGSKKIGKEQEEDEDYYCDDCLEFFPEPKTITDEKSEEKGEDEEMGNRYTCVIDREKIKLLAPDKTVPEISKETGYKIPSIRTALYAMGIKAKAGHRGNYQKSSNIEKPEIKKQKLVSPKPLSDITAVDMLIAERNDLQARVFKINQAIELLS
jgi:hypothetical protein